SAYPIDASKITSNQFGVMECRRYDTAIVARAAHTTNESMVVAKYITRTVTSSKCSDTNLRQRASKLILQGIGTKGPLQTGVHVGQRSRINTAHSGRIAQQAVVNDVGQAPRNDPLNSWQPNQPLHCLPKPARQGEL